MKAELMTLQVRSRREWRAWLAKHHTSSPGVWLECYKDHTGVKSIPYDDMVREALCFGWIDSLVKRLDDDRYARKLTPRRTSSKWSDLNRKRWAELETAGLLTSAGLRAAPTTNTYAPKPIGPRPARIHRQSVEDTLQSVGVFPRAGANRSSALRGVDSYGSTTGNAGETDSRIDPAIGSREHARLEVMDHRPQITSFEPACGKPVQDRFVGRG